MDLAYHQLHARGAEPVDERRAVRYGSPSRAGYADDQKPKPVTSCVDAYLVRALTMETGGKWEAGKDESEAACTYVRQAQCHANTPRIPEQGLTDHLITTYGMKV